MKKLVFMFVAIAAMSFASCGNKKLLLTLLTALLLTLLQLLQTQLLLRLSNR